MRTRSLLVANHIIESTECGSRTRTHRDDDLFVGAVRAVACCEHTWNVRRAVTVDDDLTEVVAFDRVEPVRVRDEADLDEDAFEFERDASRSSHVTSTRCRSLCPYP